MYIYMYMYIVCVYIYIYIYIFVYICIYICVNVCKYKYIDLSRAGRRAGGRHKRVSQHQAMESSNGSKPRHRRCNDIWRLGPHLSKCKLGSQTHGEHKWRTTSNLQNLVPVCRHRLQPWNTHSRTQIYRYGYSAILTPHGTDHSQISEMASSWNLRKSLPVVLIICWLSNTVNSTTLILW